MTINEFSKRYPVASGIIGMAIYGACQLAMFTMLFCLTGVCGK